MIIVHSELKSWLPTLSSRTRINGMVKDEAATVLATMGLTVSDAVHLLLTRVAHDKALPLEPFRPNAETIVAMDKARRGGGQKFGSIKALMADLGAND